MGCLLPLFLAGLSLLTSALASAPPLPDFTAVVEKATPAIVNIYVLSQGKEEGLESQLGSGFVVAKDGLILTSAHLVEGAARITVRLSDGREAVARLLGSDPKSDLALLKVPLSNLPTLPWASRPPSVGEWVVAIGSPFGFDHTVTVGIISAKDRLLEGNLSVPFLQTDAAINPGSSGGPLLNLEGEVVGVNTMIYSQSEGFTGLAFAVPSSTARWIMAELRERGKVTWGWLGLEVQEAAGRLARAFGLKEPRGLVVVKVVPDSPAARAGLRIGDVLLYVDERPLRRRSDLFPYVASKRVGSRLSLLFWRRGHLFEGEARVAAAPEEGEEAPGQEREGELIAPLGLVLEESEEGLVVRRVVAKEAQEAGIQEGDLLVAIGDREVFRFAQLEGTLEPFRQQKAWIPLLLEREGQRFYVVLKP